MRHLTRILFSLYILFVLSFFTVIVPLLLINGSKCVENGYTKHVLNYKLESYCFKRVNGTDVVVPLNYLYKQVK